MKNQKIVHISVSGWENIQWSGADAASIKFLKDLKARKDAAMAADKELQILVMREKDLRKKWNRNTFRYRDEYAKAGKAVRDAIEAGGYALNIKITSDAKPSLRPLFKQ